MQRHQLLKRHEKVSVDFGTLALSPVYHNINFFLSSSLRISPGAVRLQRQDPDKNFEDVMCSIAIKKNLTHLT